VKKKQTVHLIKPGEIAATVDSFVYDIEDDDSYLKPMQAHVNGYIEGLSVHYLGAWRDAYVNEDGISMRLPANARASLISRRHIYGVMVVMMEIEDVN
jgi:hypothetical protein